MDIWDVLWSALSVFVLVAYLIVLFNVVADVFRDKEMSGWVKAVWLLFLVFVPGLTALVYVVVRGQGMNQRAEAAAVQARNATEQYIRTVATSSPAEQIAAAKKLHDEGTISAEEFDVLKQKALAA